MKLKVTIYLPQHTIHLIENPVFCIDKTRDHYYHKIADAKEKKSLLGVKNYLIDPYKICYIQFEEIKYEFVKKNEFVKKKWWNKF